MNITICSMPWEPWEEASPCPVLAAVSNTSDLAPTLNAVVRTSATSSGTSLRSGWWIQTTVLHRKEHTSRRKWMHMSASAKCASSMCEVEWKQHDKFIPQWKTTKNNSFLLSEWNQQTREGRKHCVFTSKIQKKTLYTVMWDIFNKAIGPQNLTAMQLHNHNVIALHPV